MIKNTEIPAMKQAVQVIFDMSADTALREKARFREKALFDEASNMQGAREEGRAEGIAIGEVKGRVEEKSEIAANMRRNGFSEEQIKLALGM